MPFVERVVEPKYLSRASLRDEDNRSKVTDDELQAVTNCTLSNALRQLASLVLLAEDIFSELTVQLQGITERSKAAQTKIVKITEIVDNYDPKKVPVPEGSLSDFALSKVHYKAEHPLKKDLFTPDTRPVSLKKLYEKASSDPLTASFLDHLRKDSEHSPFLLCTPVLGSKRRKLYQKVDVDIETRIPISVEHLRKWTSKEAVGEVTVLPDASMRISSGVTLTPEELSECGSGDEEPIDHRLPSPEEQLRVIATKFPPELIAIDTSGKFFDRMSISRKSLVHIETGLTETDTVKRRTRTRKPRGKRRNTISGTDQKELREAIAGDASNATTPEDNDDNGTVIRSRSSDLLKKSPIDPAIKKSHFNSLKQWGKNRLKMMGRSPSASRDSFRDSLRLDKSKEASSPPAADEQVAQETVTVRRRRTDDDRRTHQRCASYSSSEKSIGVLSGPPATASVKLRGAAQRRARDEPHSSSGNWSASSESGRTSIGSEITSTTAPPRSTTSGGTSSTSLHAAPTSSIISRRRFLNTSGSGSATSEGTLTPDIINDLHDDLETSSEFSCDTEGYYTSFHMDSGLKTLKEEDVSPSTPLHTSNALSNSSNSQNLTAESEYELFGKGSTSTTTSSAGTVCTTLRAADSDRSLAGGPTVPERKSSLTKINRINRSVQSANASLDRSMNSFSKSPYSSLRFNPVMSYEKHNNSSPEINLPPSMITITRNVGSHMTAVAEIHETDLDLAKKSTGTSSPDSGHNTSSSPIEDSVSSAPGKNSLSEQDYSESSDLEGTDRIERIRYKTTINSSRIPSLCVITPNNSDDESESSNKEDSSSPTKPETETVMKKSSSRPKLDLPPEEKPKAPKTNTSADSAKPKTHSQLNLKTSLQPLNNLMCKLKGVLPMNKLSNKKSPVPKELDLSSGLYDSGDYVTIADVKNNNQKMSFNRPIYGNNDIVRKNLQTVLSGKLPDTEYVSLNELPNCLHDGKDCLELGREEKGVGQLQGAKVTLDALGQVVYSSDTLRRRKGAHTTFEPGPCVQRVTPAALRDETDFPCVPAVLQPPAPPLADIVIKAAAPAVPRAAPAAVSPPPPRVVSAVPHPVPPRAGAFVNIHDSEGVSLSPTKDDSAGFRHSSADRPLGSQHRAVRSPVIDLSGLTPSLHKPHAAHLSGRHGVISYDHHNNPPPQPQYWTLPKRGSVEQSLPRSTSFPQRKYPSPVVKVIQEPARPAPSSAQNSLHEDSIRVSPIDPRSTGPFKSSTPSNKENVADLGIRLLSPVKSTMTNEELYAVIHKSKKKLNIRDGPERSESPALSTISLSPVNSEMSLYNRGTLRRPETGYLGDPRTRNSWSPADKTSLPYNPSAPHHAQKQETTCADRHGPIPQTSRLDFKKLLLQHSVKLNTLPQNKSNKISAVEQLKLSKEKGQSPPPVQAANRSQINILDLSGSPKTYAHRKIMKPVPQPASPGRTGALIKEHKNTPKILLSPKSQWRFSSPRSDVLSSPIPEANNEDDTSISSGEKYDNSPNGPQYKTVPISTNQHFGARRNLIPINENMLERDTESPESFDQGIFPINSNINNMSRAEVLQARRAEFFSKPPESSPPKLSSFRQPHQTRNKLSPEKRIPSPSTLETAL